VSFNLVADGPEKEDLAVFNRSAWIWHPIWEYVETHYPEISNQVKYGHSNDGDGLSGGAARDLGLKLRSDIDSGIAEKYVDKFNLFLKSLEDVTCPRCLGFGLNRIGILRSASSQCIKCEGSGRSRPPVCSYFMVLGDLEEFSNFLVNCGGFRIH
jgi:DnaJ-class molecular chaperone